LSGENLATTIALLDIYIKTQWSGQWDHSGKRSNRIFKKGGMGRISSWLNYKRELWRSINGFGGNFEEERETSGTSIRSTDSTL
jgi:hypothetical protein